MWVTLIHGRDAVISSSSSVRNLRIGYDCFCSYRLAAWYGFTP
jgi:hypothetical protein